MTPVATLDWRTTDNDVADQGNTATAVYQVVGAKAQGGLTAAQVAKAMVYSTFAVEVGSVWPYSTNSPMVCRSVEARPRSPVMHEVIAAFAVSPTGYFLPSASPLLLPVRYEFKTCIEEQPFDRDVDNNPVVNSAGSPPSPPKTKTITKKVLRVLKNESTFPDSYDDYENTVNSDTVTITLANGSERTFPPGTMKCVSIEPEHALTSFDFVVPVVKTFELYNLSNINITDPHQLHLLDEGRTGWFDATPDAQTTDAKQGPFVLQDGTNGGRYVQCPEPVLLDGHGKPLVLPSTTDAGTFVGVNGDDAIANPAGTPAGATIENAASNAAVYLRWTRYKKVPFASLVV